MPETTMPIRLLRRHVLLPPPSEGWRKVKFSLCPPFRGGTPSQVWTGGYPITGPGGGATPSQVWMGGNLSKVWMGGTLSQVWAGGTPSCWWGIPHPRKGYPHPGLECMGYPNLGLDRVPPPPLLPPSGDRSVKWALAMWQAVCLLLSHRRTFLC